MGQAERVQEQGRRRHQAALGSDEAGKGAAAMASVEGHDRGEQGRHEDRAWALSRE